MNEFNSADNQDTSTSNQVSIEAIKARIADISSKPLNEHSDEFESVHAQLQRALSGIDGL